MTRSMKIMTGTSVLLGALLAAGCGNLLSTPPSTLSRAISAGPTVTAAQTSLSIAWTTNAAARHVLEYGTVSGSYPQTTPASSVADTSHSETLSGLSAGTTYYYHVKHFWDTGAYSVSGEYTAATTAEATPTLAQKIRGIWMVGGVSANTIASVVSRVDLYDPATDSWYAAVATLPTPVSFAGAVGYTRPLDGHHLVVVLGGFDGAGAVVNSIQMYDVEADSWSSGTLASARANIYATQAYDKVYVLGGTTGAAGGAYGSSTSIQEYTIGSTCTTLATAITTSSERFTFGYDDIVYHIGGRSAATTLVTAANSIDGYSIGGKGATPAAEIQYAQPVGNVIRTGVAGALWRPVSVPGAAQIILVGGVTSLVGTSGCFIANNTTTGPATNIVYYLFFPFTSPQPVPPAASTTVWSAGAVYPTPISFGSAVVIGNTLYHFGGTSSVTTSASGQVAGYRTDLTALPTNTWTSIANMPVPGRWGHVAVTFPQ